MKTMRVIMLTAVMGIFGVLITASGAETQKEKNVDAVTAIACDTTKCQVSSCHVGRMQVCTGHKGMKCEMAGTADCRDMRTKGTCTGHSPEKCTK
jgi:hypothetical protein